MDTDTTTTAAAAAGYKLVKQDYTPLVNIGAYCYTPGSTHWIKWRGNSKLPPRPLPCTRFALHYCQHALQTVRYVDSGSHGVDIDSLRLLRVTPLRWPGASVTDLPLFVDANCSVFPKRATHGLHVVCEITDAAERRALLSGTLRRRNLSLCHIIDTTIVNGRITLETYTDALGNVVYQSDRQLFNGKYLLESDRTALPWVEPSHAVEVAERYARQRDGDSDDEKAMVVFIVRDAASADTAGYQIKAEYTAAQVMDAVKRFKAETTTEMEEVVAVTADVK